jgi:hypothetical protein
MHSHDRSLGSRPSTQYKPPKRSKPLDNDKILRNAKRHFEDIVHDINKAVDNTNAGNFGTNPRPLWESVCPTDANNYQHAQRIHLGITDNHNSRKDNQPANSNGEPYLSNIKETTPQILFTLWNFSVRNSNRRPFIQRVREPTLQQ